MCHLPRTAWQNVWSRPCGSNCGWSLWTNTTPEVPIDVLSSPVLTMPLPTAPAAQSPAPPTTLHCGGEAEQLGGVGGERAGDFFRLVARGQQAGVEFQLVEQRLRPAAIDHVQQQRAAGVAHFGGELAGEPAADFVLGQQHLHGAGEVLAARGCGARGSWAP